MRAWDFHVLLFYFVSFHLVIVWFVNYLSQFHFEIYLLIVPFMNGWTFVFRNLEYAVTKDATDHIASHTHAIQTLTLVPFNISFGQFVFRSRKDFIKSRQNFCVRYFTTEHRTGSAVGFNCELRQKVNITQFNYKIWF